MTEGSFKIFPLPIYSNGHEIDAEDKAIQLRHLALIGLAASDSRFNIKHLDTAYVSLFEVMAALADEVAQEVESRKVGDKRQSAA
jgi:hypothetical protein